MLTEIRIYFEGHRALKPGFSQFFADLRERARSRRCKFELISGGSGSNVCNDFARALRTHPRSWNILLIDSEGPDTRTLSETLCRNQGWDTATRDSIFWMVEMMESWFHADKEALEAFYGPDFRKNALKPNPNVEDISKSDLKHGLRNATEHTKKGDYFDNKTSHGPALLSVIGANKVRSAAPNCRGLFEAVLARLSALNN